MSGNSDSGYQQDITDPATGLSQLLSEQCATCILRAFLRETLRKGTYVLLRHPHLRRTPGLRAGSRGFFDAFASRSPALRVLRAFGRLTEVQPRAAALRPSPVSRTAARAREP